MTHETVPEILRTHMSSAVLHLKVRDGNYYSDRCNEDLSCYHISHDNDKDCYHISCNDSYDYDRRDDDNDDDYDDDDDDYDDVLHCTVLYCIVLQFKLRYC